MGRAHSPAHTSTGAAPETRVCASSRANLAHHLCRRGLALPPTGEGPPPPPPHTRPITATTHITTAHTPPTDTSHTTTTTTDTQWCMTCAVYASALYGRRRRHPLQGSRLGNPRDGRAWWAAVHGVANSRTRLSDFTFTHWRRKWQPTPVFLPGEPQGRWSLVGCRLWGHTELDTTEAT